MGGEVRKGARGYAAVFRRMGRDAAMNGRWVICGGAADGDGDWGWGWVPLYPCVRVGGDLMDRRRED